MNDENKDYINNQEQETNAFEQTESTYELAEEVNQEAVGAEFVDEEAHEEPVIQIEQEDCQEFLVSDKKKEKKAISPLVVVLTSAVMICLILATAILFANKDFSNSTANKSDLYHTSDAGGKNVANSDGGQFVPTGSELTTAEIAAKVGPSVVGIESKVYSVNFFNLST